MNNPGRSSSVHNANVQFHSALVQAGAFEKQPYLVPQNRARVTGILTGIRGRAPGGRLLDVGCGTGFVISLAGDLFDSIDGVDITEAMLAKVTPSAKVRTQIACVEELPFPDSSFDVVTAYNLLHHLESLETAFAEIRRVLRPTGLFYADHSPNHYALTVLKDDHLDDVAGSVFRQQAQAVRNDANVYAKNYGIPENVTQEAMFQNLTHSGLVEEDVRAELERAGFGAIEYGYHWFLGEGTRSHEEAAIIDGYLREALPASRGLFKYVMLIAQ